MGGTPRSKNKPGPSYEEGRLRDPEIERRQVETFSNSDLAAIIKKAAQVKEKRSGS